MINRYSYGDFTSDDRDPIAFYYLSEEFQNLQSCIRESSLIYKDYLMDLQETVGRSGIYKMIGFFIPDYELNFIAIVLHSLPKQIYYQLKMVGSTCDREQKFWDLLISRE